MVFQVRVTAPLSSLAYAVPMHALATPRSAAEAVSCAGSSVPAWGATRGWVPLVFHTAFTRYERLVVQRKTSLSYRLSPAWASCPVPLVRTARRRLAGVARKDRTEAPGRTCPHRSRPCAEGAVRLVLVEPWSLSLTPQRARLRRRRSSQWASAHASASRRPAAQRPPRRAGTPARARA